MKAIIKKDGVLEIKPENKDEDKILNEWYNKNGRQVARNVIVFSVSDS
ncbi:hypothetical protein [Polaribacter sp. ALD11]|nr:hypothetical protein [Polaribacter sp. ALD11]